MTAVTFIVHLEAQNGELLIVPSAYTPPNGVDKLEDLAARNKQLLDAWGETILAAVNTYVDELP